MRKTVILVQNKKFYYFPYLKNENIDVISLCGKHERFWLRLCKYFPKLVEIKLYLQLKNKKYNQIVVFDTVVNLFNNTQKVLKKIKTKKILYIWNMLENNQKLIDKFYLFDRVYSFSSNDCQKYGLNYLPLVAYDISNRIKNNLNEEYQFFFLGYSKNRMSDIQKIYKHFSSYKTKFIVITNNSNNKCEFELRNKRVSYDEYIKFVLASNCLIDINNSNQDGYTLRMAEAFCYNKKIITTNKKALTSEFYDSSRILIYDENITSEDISIFLNKPINSKKSNYFDFDTWLDKITNS